LEAREIIIVSSRPQVLKLYLLELTPKPIFSYGALHTGRRQRFRTVPPLEALYKMLKYSTVKCNTIIT